uniref:50S ribosomal protein L12, chloroplastic n=1 Tax=Halydictyon mirabile TaxID=189652 RepID=A0A4D6WWJ2_9FLOR|nr:ribosomal protein L12 [Halydictyon mirabile]
MSQKIDAIIESLKSLTLLEAAELVKQIEQTFDVDTSTVSNSSMVMLPNSSEALTENAVEEKTEFDISLEEVPSTQKIPILKVVRSITSLGLKEAKELVESTPKIIKESVSKEEAEEIKNQLEEAGAVVSIK